MPVFAGNISADVVNNYGVCQFSLDFCSVVFELYIKYMALFICLWFPINILEIFMLIN